MIYVDEPDETNSLNFQSQVSFEQIWTNWSKRLKNRFQNH